MRAQGRCQKKQEKDLALYCARSLTTAHSAGSLRGFQITLFPPKQKGCDAFLFKSMVFLSVPGLFQNAFLKMSMIWAPHYAHKCGALVLFAAPQELLRKTK